MKKRLKSYYRSYLERKTNRSVERLISHFEGCFTPNDHILITGSPRSGSTWLAELLEEYTGKILVFEPLSIARCKRFDDLGFSWRQHIPENEEWPGAEEVYYDLFAGKYLNPWMLSYTQPSRLNTADGFIIKFVRANLMLPWLIRKFEFKYKPIFLIRHPFSVVYSQINQEWKSKSKQPEQIENEFNHLYNKQYQSLIEKAKTPVQKAMLRWCLDNVYILQHPDRDKKWVMVYYEDLFLNPETEFRKMILAANIELNETRLKTLDFEKVSSTAFKETPDIGQKMNQLGKWKKKLTTEQIAEGLEVLGWFNIAEYGEDILPIK